jgi:hypothetical protein
MRGRRLGGDSTFDLEGNVATSPGKSTRTQSLQGPSGAFLQAAITDLAVAIGKGHPESIDQARRDLRDALESSRLSGDASAELERRAAKLLARAPPQPGQPPPKPVPERVRKNAFSAAGQIKNVDSARRIVEIRAEAPRADLDPAAWATEFVRVHPGVSVEIMHRVLEAYPGSPKLAAILARALDPDPDARPSARELVALFG